MPAKIKTSRLRPEHSDEYMVLVSALGASMHLSIPVSDVAHRQDRINEALAILDANDAAMIAYAQQHGLPAPQEIES